MKLYRTITTHLINLVIALTTVTTMVPYLSAAEPDRTGTAAPLANLRHDLIVLQARHHIPVLAVSIAENADKVQTITLGATPATPLRWGSITKTFTALTVLGLSEAGLVDLQAPLSRYVDPVNWQNPWRETDPVKVIHLLELRAGFTDLSGQEFNYNEPISLSAALALNPSHRITRWPPGLQHGYSNMTPGLTQILIEQVSGLSYARAAEKYAFLPLSMQDAGFQPRADLPGGFRADGETPIPYWHMTFAAYGALNAPLQDMNRLLMAMLGDGGLSDLSRQHMLRPHGREVGADFTFDYAAGFYPRVRRGHIWHGHGGDADGYRARISVLHGQPRGYVVNINTDNPDALRQIERLLETYLTAGLATPTPPAVAAMEATGLAGLAGTYYPASTRFGYAAWQAGELQSISIIAHSDHLEFSNGKRITRLYVAGKNKFRRSKDPEATVFFATTDSHTLMQGELGNFARTDHCPDFIKALPQCNDQ